jgi:hypothetical protein
MKVNSNNNGSMSLNVNGKANLLTYVGEDLVDGLGLTKHLPFCL